ncbi:flagellin [Phycicoccus sp. 3266]|uniref:flagellin N-terminal helical domain-containing protein n=1 Tax=Phycicoccus sp. 3266 TaxID=2817751 RepID=UPI002858931D|nr:flagellin [Phycicoccus sp. 3266]MDR6862969.1 flagellin [Phycicoccus sp. 3266]
MGLQINTNVAAMNAYRNLSSTQGSMATSLERLSSGLRINRAADDAAGLAISEKLRAQTNGLNQATSNAQDAISLVQTAEGALNETHSILQRMRQLAVQSANDTNTDADRAQIQKEVGQLSQELDRISSATQFNKQDLLAGDTVAGTSTKSFTFQIGANAGQELKVSINKVDAASLKVSAPAVAGTAGATEVDVTTQANAKDALTKIDGAIDTVSGQRADLGAVQNRLQHTINSLSVASENSAAAESRIRDTDMAKEMTSFTRSQILQQAGVSMLAQANSAPQSVLKLLG